MLIFYDKHFDRYSRLFALLVRMVVETRKVFTFIGENLRARRRRHADFSENCLYIGREETFAGVLKLISASSILKNPQFVEGEGRIGLDVKGLDGIDAILFDTTAFTYDAILDWMSERAGEGRRYTMGLYSEKTGKLITEDETL